MSSLTFTFVKASLLRKPGRTVFSILGIALGIATVVGVYTLDHNTIVGLSKRPDQNWRPALEVNPGNDPDTAQDRLRSLKGISDICRIFQNDVDVSVPGLPAPTTPAGGRPSGPRARLFAVESGPISDFDTWRVLDGRTLAPNASQREVLIGEAIAAQFGVGPGDTIQLSRPRRAARRDCVDGEMKFTRPAGGTDVESKTFEVVGILAREKLGWFSRGRVVIVDYEPALELFSGVRISERFWVRQDPKSDIESVRATLADNFSYDFNKRAVIGQAADERAFRNGARMAGLLALVLGLYVIFHTLSMALLERVNEVAILHALGSTRRRIARVFLTEAFVIAGLGGVLGLAGGLALAWGLMYMGVSTVGMGKGRHIVGFVVPWDAALSLTALGVAVALLGSVFPLLRAGSSDTIAALRGEEALKGGKASRGFSAFAALLVLGILPGLYFVIVPVVGDHQGTLIGVVLGAVAVMVLLLVIPLVVPSILALVCEIITRPFTKRWPFAGSMASSGIRNARTRVAVSVSAIALVTAAFVGLKGMTRSITGEVLVWAEDAFVNKVYFTGLPDVDVAELSAAVAANPDVIGLELGSARRFGSFLLLGSNVDDLTGYGPLQGNEQLVREMKTQHGIILSRRLAVNDGYELGDLIPITIGGGAVQDFRVLAINDEYGYFSDPDERLYGVIHSEYLRKYFCVDVGTTDNVALRVREGAPMSAASGLLSELYGSSAGIGSLSGPELKRFFIEDIEVDFILFDVILGLTAILAGLGVLNGQLLSALERAKEIGILKALGVSRSQVAGMVLLESLVIGSLGATIGLALGASLTPLIIVALQELSGLPLPVGHAGLFLLWSLIGAVTLTVIAGLYPVWRMNRMDPVRAVRTG